jgi:hypothetical protein
MRGGVVPIAYYVFLQPLRQWPGLNNQVNIENQEPNDVATPSRTLLCLVVPDSRKPEVVHSSRKVGSSESSGPTA